MKLKYKDPCEYNPETKEAAYENEVHAEAEVMIGKRVAWRLCKKCAELPEFKRFKVRRMIKKS